MGVFDGQYTYVSGICHSTRSCPMSEHVTVCMRLHGTFNQCNSVYIPENTQAHTGTCLFVLSFYLSIYLSISLSLYLSIYLSIYMSTSFVFLVFICDTTYFSANCNRHSESAVEQLTRPIAQPSIPGESNINWSHKQSLTQLTFSRVTGRNTGT